jgi:hypothetical protein
MNKSKKEELLGKANNTQLYDLTENEKIEVASLIALEEQAQAARNFIYSRIVSNVADRFEISNKDISLNWEEIMSQGAKVAKLVVKD